MIRTAVLLAASLVVITSAHTADKPKEAPAALERKLHGAWEGGPCIGELTFFAEVLTAAVGVYTFLLRRRRCGCVRICEGKTDDEEGGDDRRRTRFRHKHPGLKTFFVPSK